jgi:hypothetical protein
MSYIFLPRANTVGWTCSCDGGDMACIQDFGGKTFCKMVTKSARDSRLTFNMVLWEVNRNGSGYHQMAEWRSYDLPDSFKK